MFKWPYNWFFFGLSLLIFISIFNLKILENIKFGKLWRKDIIFNLFKINLDSNKVNKINKQNKRITLKVKIKIIISSILIQESLKNKKWVKKLIKVEQG